MKMGADHDNETVDENAPRAHQILTPEDYTANLKSGGSRIVQVQNINTALVRHCEESSQAPIARKVAQ